MMLRLVAWRAFVVPLLLFGAASAASAQSDSALVVKAAGNTLLRVDRNGKVGLGTATPAVRLQVDSGGVLFRGDDGFAVLGTLHGDNSPGAGAIPVSGAGARLMWYGAKGAFRAGYAEGGGWDDASAGVSSFAGGFGTVASGWAATAFGYESTAGGIFGTAIGGSAAANGYGSTAMGYSATANGDYSVALGSNVQATGTGSIAIGLIERSSGLASVAMGRTTTADGNYSVALGSAASTNAMAGSFIFGDNSTSSTVLSPGANTFTVRAAGGIWLGTTNTTGVLSGAFIGTSTGAYLSTGGTWTNSSDVRRKHLFADVAGEDVLARLRAMPVRSWSYRAESDSIRHLGPTAQDFRRAFSLGNDSTSIATVDADGVSLAGVQALDARTLRQQTTIDSLRAENAARDARIRTLEGERESARNESAALAARVARLETLLKREQ